MLSTQRQQRQIPLVEAANGRVFAQNGIQPFARGGIVDRPTLFPFAKGTGLMGEAGPEAIMPLRRGRDGKLGVAGGGGGTTNVVVNVDASGSKVEGDQSQAKALGNVISAAVQSELVRQKRPGGLLA
jgi:phage-related minor tail protein